MTERSDRERIAYLEGQAEELSRKVGVLWDKHNAPRYTGPPVSGRALVRDMALGATRRNVDRWRDAGLISAEQAEAIYAHEVEL